ncbi:MAG: C39 family peptidase [Planctomycetales bacterium]|nr:C39 family peptidase [Planctomycetales bacterium]
MEYLVEGVPYIAQPTATTCWNAAYKMMLKYKGKSELAADSLPNDEQMRKRGILDAEFVACRQKIGLTSSTYKAFLTADDIKTKLQTYGPIWVSGTYCESAYKHIVVLRGVRSPWIGDDEVYINDPYSGFKYGLDKPRWFPLDKFVSKINKVDFCCQHWL